ncbi:hypothetical protein GCM10017750_05910 [Streptomyces racemochromogenes]
MGDHTVATVVLSEVQPRAGDLSIWPASTTRLAHGGLAVGGVPLAEIAERFDTRAYVLDEGEVRERCRTYRDAFPEADVLYAAKAFLSRAMVRWVREEGLGLDVVPPASWNSPSRPDSLPNASCCTATPSRPATWKPRCASAWGGSSSTARRR